MRKVLMNQTDPAQLDSDFTFDPALPLTRDDALDDPLPRRLKTKRRGRGGKYRPAPEPKYQPLFSGGAG